MAYNQDKQRILYQLTTEHRAAVRWACVTASVVEISAKYSKLH